MYMYMILFISILYSLRNIYNDFSPKPLVLLNINLKLLLVASQAHRLEFLGGGHITPLGTVCFAHWFTYDCFLPSPVLNKD